MSPKFYNYSALLDSKRWKKVVDPQKNFLGKILPAHTAIPINVTFIFVYRLIIYEPFREKLEAV
jgi:hypothetical protein